ncbi:MAG: phospho-sugar mutase [Oscillospiraceae bacterium]|nr:phospho-sugar mutase [Oscillospiraceae bacterium]
MILKNRALLEYERWLAEVPADSPWRAGLEALGADGAGRFDAFRCGLAFGTGGLRAEIGPGSNRMNHYVVGRATQGLANYLKKAYPGQSLLVCIAHDTRHCSAEFAAHAACALCAAGIRVKRFPQPRPTPMLSFAVREYKAQAGIVITASHNPKEYNGYKVYGETGGQLTDAAALAVLEEIDKLDLFEAARATEKMTQALALQKGLLGDLGDEADELYYEKSSAFLPRRAFTRQNAAKLKLIYSPLHGSGLVPVTRLLKKLDYAQLRVVPEQEQPDGDFPTVAKPNPEERDTFLLAMELAKTVQPDVIFATDPDADRLGVLAQNDRGEFEVLSGTQTGALLCDYLIQAYRERPGGLPPNPAIVTTVVTGTLAERICKANGVAVKKVLTGFKYIGETMDAWQANGAHSFLFGFEESYGYLTGDVCRDKDAVIAAALVAEMALYYKLEKNKTLYQALQELYQSYGPVCEALVNLDAKGADGQVFIAGLMKNIRENYAAVLPGETVLFLEDYLAGERRDLQTGVCSAIDLPRSDVVKLFFADGAWLVLRPSGTEPKIKLYLCTGDAFAPGESLDEARRRVEALAQKAKALLG